MLIVKNDTTNIEIEVKAFEEKYNFVFPEEYKKLLLKYNGGNTPETTFKINRISSDFTGFYGLGNAKPNYSFLERSNVLEDYFEEHVVPIGGNCFGDDIVMGIGEENSGKIYFLYHDRPRKYKELTNSLRDFLEICKSKKIKPTRSLEERREAMIAVGRESFITDGLLRAWQAEIDESIVIQEELILE